ncbi:hypothetical protein DL89DRAFT_265090 [Linderina pennispora]|uniref:Pescadillo homolog n=1 Tax=Linderina pennispora TaxID=61395 RepID=A0A1Y1WHV4_9FUNG|nr:uncharacterized protein DL89DRAFT_265090 [Linderina pennispora]ORX72918.1 hypothetical protein DL89DRAFT_265090 [Linderina pennispora]
MGKIKKKFTEGASTTYITRNRALKKLQVSLADFRRLCILKGIYPVEPKNRKKANRGSSKPTTFYYAKDIQLLLSEPLIAKFREHKTFLRKLQHALGKHDITKAKDLHSRRPQYTLDHLVRERYPSFADALRDLDDALCMLFLFATMPVVKNVSNEVVEECKRLSAEFMHFVVHSHALRKVFLSIKGIYYQAEISGQTVTWIVPYQFSQHIPLDVDFRVMATFLEFYRTLLGFVNYRLFTTANLAYPPKVDADLDDSAAGLGSLRVESKRVEDLIKENDDEETTAIEEKHTKVSKEMKQRLSTLGAKIKSLATAEDAPEYSSVTVGGDDSEARNEDDDSNTAELLFNKQVFFLSREVPRYSLEFVIRAFGGRLGWASSSGGGSPYSENDTNITVQICDRPVQGHQFLNRTYLQPQWVYDSINARRLLPTDDYLVGQQLPPHLSPFVEYADGDYIPEAAAKFATAEGFEGDVEKLKPEDEDEEESEGEEDAEIEGDSADEEESDDEDEDDIAEKQHQKQLLAESQGLSFTEYQQKAGNKKAKKPAAKKRSKAEEEEEERQRIAISMLSRKKRKLVNRTQDEAKKRAKDINALHSRKAQVTKAAKKAARK